MLFRLSGANVIELFTFVSVTYGPKKFLTLAAGWPKVASPLNETARLTKNSYSIEGTTEKVYKLHTPVFIT